MNLGNAIRFWSHWRPDDASIVDAADGTTVSWAELHARTSRLANGLAGAGLRSGDRVGILSNNCIEYLEIVLAGYKLGTILVPLNVRLTPTELSYIIEQSGCRALVADEALAETAATALAAISDDVVRVGLGPNFGTPLGDLRRDDPQDPDAPVGPEDIAYICYTSGTTGVPKGAMLSHGNILAMSANRILADDMTTSSRIYLPFPISFTGGLVSTYAPTYVAGATLVLDSDVEPGRALRVIEAQAITNFSAVPVIWEMIVRHPDFADRDLSSLEVIGAGGAAVPSALLEQLQDAGLPMSQGYGLTEGGGYNSWLRAEDAARKLGSCGKPMMHTKVRTVDPERTDELVDVSDGEVGELLISGPEVMVGYWKNPDATAATIVDGWLRTGDLARIDEEGYITIVDRSKDMLISGGLNVYPAEIESVIAAIDGVAECAVIGVPDARWGETPAAMIGRSPGSTVDAAAIVQVCRVRLADYKCPRYVVMRDQPLPRGMSGKVLKRELRDEYGDAVSLGPAIH
ncbi:MAG: AMP-binding protein [Acidimicrobiia bacterium]|nr:AMP-binding protein [Acidimicrobiia bacterium]